MLAGGVTGPSAALFISFFLVGPEQVEMQLWINCEVMIYMAGDIGKHIILGRSMRWDVFTVCLGKLSALRCLTCACIENACVRNSR